MASLVCVLCPLVSKQPQRRYRLIDVLDWAGQLANGLKALHEREIVHGDMQLRNLMLRSKEEGGGVVIVDVGTAAYWERAGGRGVQATVPIHGPHVDSSVRGNETALREQWGPAIDVYAFGVCVYQLALFIKQAEQGDIDKIESGAMSEEDLVRQMVRVWGHEVGPQLKGLAEVITMTVRRLGLRSSLDSVLQALHKGGHTMPNGHLPPHRPSMNVFALCERQPMCRCTRGGTTAGWSRRCRGCLTCCVRRSGFTIRVSSWSSPSPWTGTSRRRWQRSSRAR